MVHMLTESLTRGTSVSWSKVARTTLPVLMHIQSYCMAPVGNLVLYSVNFGVHLTLKLER